MKSFIPIKQTADFKLTNPSLNPILTKKRTTNKFEKQQQNEKYTQQQQQQQRIKNK